MFQITRIESTQSRVLCCWNMDEVKEGKLKYNKERIRKISQTAIKQGNKMRDTKHEEEKQKNTNKMKVVKIMTR